MALRELLEEGTIRPVVERSYPLSEAADALRYLGEGHAPGKLVITVTGPGAGPGHGGS